MKYYSIEIRKKKQDPNDEFWKIMNLVAASNEEELKNKIQECVEDFDAVDNYIDESYEVTEAEAIIRLEKEYKHRIIKSYLKRNNYDELSVREYCKISKEFNKDEGYFKVLKEEAHISYIRNTLFRRYDLSKISVVDFEDIVSRLRVAKTDDEFEEMASKLVGKEIR